ncbi:MAG: ABC transporter ATP-binding protein [Pseudomonadota bacterium]
MEVIFDQVVKRFGTFTAVHGLDLAIAPGEFVALLGPSGCGKTTTLRMLAGLETLTEGTIRVGPKTVNDLPPGKRDIAMVFQSYALYPHMTVAGNIAYPLKKRGVPAAERAAKVKETAAILQLEPLLDRKPKQLSGGQQQRVALGRALVRDPQIFLLDEPLSNLDAKLRAHMRAELIELHRRLGKTMVYVTHDQLEAMTMAQRIAVMSGGHLQQFDAPETVYNRPANRFVAEFIGTPSMNLLDGMVEMADGPVFKAAGLTVPLGPAAPQGPAALGVRPEHVRLSDDGAPATIRLVEPTGHETIVMLETEGGARLTARMPANLGLAMGTLVAITLDPEGLHLFAADDDGRRIDHHPTPAAP